MQSFPFDSYVTYDSQGNPTYDRAVSSQPLRTIIRKLFTTGVMPNPSTNFQVNAGTDGMTVLVQPGFAVVDGGLCKEDEVRTLSVTAADAIYDRIDTVVLRWNENVDVRTADLYVLAGTPAETPIRPTLQRGSSIYEIGLADVFITHGIATITEDKITDTRYESERCGIVSSVSEWDTTTIYQQIQSDLAGFKSNEQAEFMTWFNKMKDQLTEDAAGKLQTEVDDLTNSVGDVKRQIHTNLLNPTAPTQTINGVTFTNNGDGTYTVNGTAMNVAYITIFTNLSVSVFQNKKIVGCPTGGSSETYFLSFVCHNGNTWLKEFDDFDGNGIVISNIPSNANKVSVRIMVRKDATANNLIFKPMLTTDLSATYNDFVPYTGDSGRLNEDISDVNGRLTQVQNQIVPAASIESGETASKAYNVGDFLVKDGILYKVTKAIAKGDALTPANIVPTTVGSELSSISEYKIKEYVFENTKVNQWIDYNIDESNAFLDGSSYLDSTDKLRYPLNYSTDNYCFIDYKNGATKIRCFSKHAGTFHVFVRYK